MSANHTPGPWTVRHADDQEYPYPARLILGERGLLVAVARAAGGPDKNAAANARLIAAAPELLEALQLVPALRPLLLKEMGYVPESVLNITNAARAILDKVCK